MSALLAVLLCLALLAASALFSGSETGVYSVSRVRVDAEASAGRRSARLVRRLLRRETLLLITLLVGNNLMLELLTHTFEASFPGLDSLPAWSRELVATAVLVPVVFLFGELLPKDLFLRRPHFLLGAAAPVVHLARLVFLPITVPLFGLSAGLQRLLGLHRHDVARAIGREEMHELLSEGARSGVIEPHARELALNVLVLRETPLSRVMIPWSRVQRVSLDQPDEMARGVVVESEFTRLPAVEVVDGVERVAGYVHQLAVLARPKTPVRKRVRPLEALPADTPLDRALARLRLSGQRMALVGDPGSPQGIVALMDLVAAISGRTAA